MSVPVQVPPRSEEAGTERSSHAVVVASALVAAVAVAVAPDGPVSASSQVPPVSTVAAYPPTSIADVRVLHPANVTTTSTVVAPGAGAVASGAGATVAAGSVGAGGATVGDAVVALAVALGDAVAVPVDDEGEADGVPGPVHAASSRAGRSTRDAVARARGRAAEGLGTHVTLAARRGFVADLDACRLVTARRPS